MTSQQVDEYLAAAPEPQRTTLTQLRATIAALLPDAEEVISYGVPTFKVGGKGVAGFGFSKDHCSYFPMSGTVTSGLAPELREYQTTKGAIRFARDEALPRELVSRLIAARQAEIAGGPTRGPRR
ncbi:MAG: DUF1801 domain-containing protein [Candidatus Nanopelagicales bacterium]